MKAYPLFTYILKMCLDISTYFFHSLVNGFSVIHNNNFKIIFRRVFSECTEAIATSLIPLVTNFPEICAFISGFNFTGWTKMRLMLTH